MAKTTDLNNMPANYHKSQYLIIHKGKHIVVFVESKENEKLFRNLLDKSCKFIPTNNKDVVIEVVNLLKGQVAIGIIDADFQRITGNMIENEQLFLTDFHDTEMMMLFSETWQQLLNYYHDVERLEKFEAKIKQDFRTFLMEQIKPLEVLRLLNEQEKLELVFKTKSNDKELKYLDYKDFINENTLLLDKQKLLTTVENKSSKLRFFQNNPNHKAKFEEWCKQDFDLKELTNGHDFLNVLAIAFSKAIGNYASSSKIQAGEMEKDLIKIYRRSDFEATNLFQSLQKWQNEHDSFKLI